MAKETYHMAKGTYHMAKETYHMAKETYHMAKETYHMAKETYHMRQVGYKSYSWCISAVAIQGTSDAFMLYSSCVYTTHALVQDCGWGGSCGCIRRS